MSKSPLPTRTLLPKGEEMLCPSTVKQSILTAAHPFSGPVLVSPDTTSGKDGPPALCSLPSALPSLPSSRSSHQQSPVPVATFGRKDGPISLGIQILAPRSTLKPKSQTNGSPPPSIPQIPSGSSGSGGIRLNKFVRRLHDMLLAEKDSGIVEWRRGLLVLHSTDAFAKNILPKHFNTRNFKTFRRQLNYYGFVHVRSFSTTGSTTTALWVNRELAKHGSAEISSVLMLKRVEPCESAKTAEGRRVRKELAIFTVEEDIGVSPKSLQMEQIRSLAMRAGSEDVLPEPALLPRTLMKSTPPVPTEVLCHYSPLPPPFFPKLSQTARQVSPVSPVEDPNTRGPNQAASSSQVSSVGISECVHDVPVVEPAAPLKDAEENVSAANLLLMLAKGGATHDAPSAISPNQFLM